MVSKNKKIEAHWQCLSRKQSKVLAALSAILDPQKFYLGGGTAIALQLGHRQSIDLDWFSNEDFGDPLLFARQLQKLGIPLDVHTSEQGTLHGSVNGVRVTFLRYNYPLLQPLQWLKPFNCMIASLDDLACMKLSAITQRGAKKDFIDIYGITRHHRSLPDLIAMYKQKYKIKNVANVIYGLSYFDNANKEKTPKLLLKIDWRHIKLELNKQLMGLSHF